MVINSLVEKYDNLVIVLSLRDYVHVIDYVHIMMDYVHIVMDYVHIIIDYVHIVIMYIL
jgi:hypothetical protein